MAVQTRAAPEWPVPRSLPVRPPSSWPCWQTPAQVVGLAGALLMALVLGGLAGTPVRTFEGARSASASVRQELGILTDAERTLAQGDRLLTTRDANPGLAEDPVWLKQHAEIVADLKAEYSEAMALSIPPTFTADRTCLAGGLRLVMTGHDLLQRGFLTDGHGAYYDAAHGNWDVQLGRQRLQRCRQHLQASYIGG